MIPEINSAVRFLSNILRATDATSSLSPDQLIAFRQSLEVAFATRYRDHWFPDRPSRGSAYRCVRIANRKLDRLLAGAGAEAGLPEPLLQRLLPAELTLWVDPEEVSYRIGEEGSVGVIYEARSAIDGSSSEESSSSTTPPSSPITTTKFSSSSGSRRIQTSPTSGVRFSPDTVNYEYLNAISSQVGAL
jgi:protein Tob/BTG